jgi:DNA-binding CsgD family transcriptional regulator
VHRAEILQLHGAWPEAVGEVELVCHRFADSATGVRDPAAAAAWYRRAELHRLVGEFAQAEDAYRLAGRWGMQPQPGLALLRLAQGRLEVAAAAVRRALAEAQDRAHRCALLPAYVEVVLATGDVPGARVAAEELARHAADLDAPPLQASAAHAEGAVLLAEADLHAALIVLRQAWSRWHELDAPYEAALARVLIASVCGALGDHDGAAMELDAAGWAFQQLGATPQLDQALRRSAGTGGRNCGPDVLTARELEVLRLVATGKTNRAIAAEMFLSEKTVARHLSNIFTKLGLASRSAATAYAYEHGLAG